MNRRHFLYRLGAGSAGLAIGMALDPERALWVPGQRSHFMAPMNGWNHEWKMMNGGGIRWISGFEGSGSVSERRTPMIRRSGTDCVGGAS